MAKKMRHKKRKALKLNIRWMIRRDMPGVVEIEQRSFKFSWGEDDFIRCLRQRNCIGMVTEYKEKIIGFMIYELHKNSLHILDFAVTPRMRHKGVGAHMISRLMDKLSNQRRNHITLEIRESNLPAQLFFKYLGFRAVSALREFYKDPDDPFDDDIEDAYLMQLTYTPKRKFKYEMAS